MATQRFLSSAGVVSHLSTTSGPDSAIPQIQPKLDSLPAEIDRLHTEVREVKFTPKRQTEIVATGCNFSYNIDDCNSVIYDSPYYETYLYLAGLGLTPDIARAAVHAAIETGTQAKNERKLAEIGLVNALPSLIKFGSDPLESSTDSNIPSKKDVVHRHSPTKPIWIVVNDIVGTGDADEVFGEIQSAAKRFLNRPVGHIGSIPCDAELAEAVRQQVPVVDYAPETPASRSFRLIARRLDQAHRNSVPASPSQSFWQLLSEPEA
jgi:hypothetical protein